MYESDISFRSVSLGQKVSPTEDDSFLSRMACKSSRLWRILSGLSSTNNSYLSSPTNASHLRTAQVYRKALVGRNASLFCLYPEIPPNPSAPSLTVTLINKSSFFDQCFAF